jgi:hypothetical protein
MSVTTRQRTAQLADLGDSHDGAVTVELKATEQLPVLVEVDP